MKLTIPLVFKAVIIVLKTPWYDHGRSRHCCFLGQLVIFNMDKWYHVERTLTNATTDFVIRNTQGETASSLQFSFETPLGDEPLFLYDDNPLFLSEVFSECSSEDDDEDISTKLYVLNPCVRLIAVWYCIIVGIIIPIPLIMWSLSFYLGLDH